MRIKLLVILLISLSNTINVFAQITPANSSGCAPYRVDFEFATTKVLTNIEWNFGDGGSSGNTLKTSHIYILKGTYNVTFEGYSGSELVKGSATVNVFGKPAPSFSSDIQNACFDVPISFTSTSKGTLSSNIVEWEWTFGNGEGSKVENPKYTYPEEGIFDVSLRVVDNNGCDSSMIIEKYIVLSTHPIPVINSDVPFTACSAPLIINFTGKDSHSESGYSGGIGSYKWTFHDGTISILESPAPQTYLYNGSYSVKLTVTDKNNCSGTSTNPANIVIGKPVSKFDIIQTGYKNGDTICPTVGLNSAYEGDLYWNLGDGTIMEHAPSGIIYQYGFKNEPVSEYTIRLTIKSGECSDVSVKTVKIENILADCTPDNLIDTCVRELFVDYTDLSRPKENIKETHWFWDGINDTIINSDTSHTYMYLTPPDDPYYIHDKQIFSTLLKVVSKHGCVSLKPIIIELKPPTILFSADKVEGCAPLKVKFHTTTWVSFSLLEEFSEFWDYGDGTTSGEIDAQTHTFTSPGVYEVKVIATHEEVCVDTSFTVVIKVGDPADLNFNLSSQEICPNENISFKDLTSVNEKLDSWHFVTDSNLMSACPQDQNPVWSYSSYAGLHDVTLNASNNGCFSKKTKKDAITVKGPVAHIAGYKIDCNHLKTVAFTSDVTGTDEVKWDFGDGTFSTELNPEHTYATSGQYKVSLTGTNLSSGCSPFTESKTVNITDLQASFVSDLEVCADKGVKFDAKTSKSVNELFNRGYYWYWGDGTKPTVTQKKSAIHSFDEAGTYEVKLIVRDINWCTDTTSLTLKVFDLHPEFTATPGYGCVPIKVDFVNKSTFDYGTALAEIKWDFGDGNLSIEENPTFTFTDMIKPSFPVTLKITDQLNCTKSKTFNILNSIPVLKFTPDTTKNCSGDSILFTPLAKTHKSYIWDMGDGTEIKKYSGSGFKYSYKNPGVYDISLTVRDSINCPASEIFKNRIFVQSYPQPEFLITEKDELIADSVCYPATLVFSDITKMDAAEFYSRKWNLEVFKNPVPIDVVTGYFPDRKNYNPSLTVTSTYGCKSTISQSFVLVGPSAKLNLSDTLICKGEHIDLFMSDTSDVKYFQYDFGDGTIDNAPTNPITHTFNFHPKRGIVYPTLIVYSNTLDCSMAYKKPLKIYQVIADFKRNAEKNTADTSQCLSQISYFENSSRGGEDYLEWNIGDGSPIYKNVENVENIYSSPGIYNISLNIKDNETGCVDTITKQIVINAIPSVRTMDSDTCAGSYVQLFSIGSSDSLTYLWSPEENISDIHAQNPIVNPPVSRHYHVIVTDENNCTAFANAFAYIQLPASASLSDWDTTIIVGQYAALNAYIDSSFIYKWESAYSIGYPESPYNLVQPLPVPITHEVSDINYFVTLRDTIGCFEEKFKFTVTVLPETTLDMPVAFTPNRDGNNEVVFVKGWGIKDLLEYKIYNRWGQLIFETDNIYVGWDGTWKGEIQNSDTYVYQVKVTTYLNTTLEKKGYINLIR